MSEQQIQRQIMDWLRQCGVLHWRQNLGGVKRSGQGMARNPMAGFPDIAGVCSGHLFVIEVKDAKGKLSPKQQEWRLLLERHRVTYVLARSLTDAVAGLEGLRQPLATAL